MEVTKVHRLIDQSIAKYQKKLDCLEYGDKTGKIMYFSMILALTKLSMELQTYEIMELSRTKI